MTHGKRVPDPGRCSVDERNVGGYSITYGGEEIETPVYVAAGLAAVLFAAWIATGATLWLVPAVAAAGVTYYNVPLLERRPAMGANQYGIFIQGLGLIRWRAIDRIELVEIAVRASTIHELQLSLKERLSSALVADWRKQPFYRSLMRLPWKMASTNVVSINLEPFNREPEEVHRTVLRLWRHYRS
ncbi:hypothetical protein C6Y62_14505 [Hyphomicrobium sulfonivorans]|nr:hypothetical protein [Hyphomicrobium sulfonivorans]NSL73022.1 hypothetical protein [Hyphomicrobium sulfonivorans]